MEIGFGGGEHLHHESGRYPQSGFIGVEPFINGMAKMLAALDQAPRPNLRLYDEDATAVLDWLPDASLAGIDLFYPDPWHKRRHWKRRFVSDANLDRFARVLKPGAKFRFASDIEHYVNWTLQHCRRHAAFDWQAESPADWNDAYEGWPGTRYEAKAFREGRRAAYLTFIRR
ncbi:tRNA guanine-N(7)-methyltransferase [Brucella sp. BO2]|nr:tRNA guanine-N(7)-methyltransferase [Brucella sp. BO2]